MSFHFQTSDIIEYLTRLSKTSIPDGIVQFIKVSFTYAPTKRYPGGQSFSIFLYFVKKRKAQGIF